MEIVALSSWLLAFTPTAVAEGTSVASAAEVEAEAATSNVWVYFRDRGNLSAEQLREALSRRSAQIHPRALARRQRVRKDAGLDIRDLAPAPSYVEAVKATGATLRHSSRWLNAVSVQVTTSQARALSKLPMVARVEPVRRAQQRKPVEGTGRMQWPRNDAGFSAEQLEIIGADYLQDCGLTGAGVVIGVQDSGFDVSHISLQDVEVLGTRDFVNNDDNVGPEQGDAPGQHSHGTLVLSTIVGVDTGNFLGVAPGAKVLLSKTEDISVEEPVEEDNFVAGIEWLEEEGADIFTASLGYFDWYTPSDLDGQTAVTTVASTIAVENGLIMFNSAGNSGPDPMTLGAPADAEGVITLGAAHFNGEIAGFSSRGPTADGRTKPEVVAPGVDVVCADPGTVDEYRTANGTSLSNPLAAGLGALLLEAYPEMTPADMLALLRETSDQADNPDNNRGWGMIDGYKAGLEYCSCNDVDNDGHTDIACGGDDCDDSLDTVHPGAEEICDGHDNDCDGEKLPTELDEDNDLSFKCDGDCDDKNADAVPGGEEICGDGVDNDCLNGDLECGETTDGTTTGDSDTGTSTVGPGSETDPTIDTDIGGTSGEDSETGTSTETDSGSGPGIDDEGCGCGVDSEQTPPAWGVLALLAGLGLRRRRV
ncbi:MAG: S8 family serine peptidase [Nannocystaceae bacterium]